jgi:hypothetical protein
VLDDRTLLVERAVDVLDADPVDACPGGQVDRRGIGRVQADEAESGVIRAIRMMRWR